MKTSAALLAICSCLSACVDSNVSTASASPQVSEDWLRSHVEFLSSDLLKGRDSATDGYHISAAYVAAQMQGLGLIPGGEDGYYQSVTLLEASLDQDSVSLAFSHGDEPYKPSYPDDFIMGPDDLREDTAVEAELVFVGYGIVAPSRDHDDYEGLEVEGKIVVILAGRPEAWPSEEGAHLGSGREKRRHAAEHGAIGAIVLHTPRLEKVFPWELNYQYLEVPDVSWEGRDGRIDGYFPQLRGGAYLNPDTGRRLFSMADADLDEIYKADLAGEPVHGFIMGVTAQLSRKSTHRRFTSPNVIGVIEGSDPDLKNETIVYSAHLDHLGVIRNSEGVEEIYPGVMDNAVGIAAMLETARVLSAERETLKRSVMFIALTAEEHGLLGAGYFTAYPTVAINNLVANINLDMPYLGFRFSDVIAFGAEHSSLQSVVADAAEAEGLNLAPDPMPDEAIFVRSDHYRFVQKGIPAVMLATGFTSADPEEDGAALFMQFLKQGYHKPADNLSQRIDYGAGALFTRVNTNIGRALAQQPERPTWHEGDFFGELFGAP